MFNSSHLIGFGAGDSSARIVLTDHAVDTSDATIYTFTSKNIGTASADRYIVVGVGTVNGGSTTISSVTVAGNAMTQVATIEGSGGGAFARNSLYIYGPLAAGLTATIVVTFSGATFRAGIGVWAVTGLNSATATATASSTADPLNASINVSAGGVLVGYSFGNAISATNTWTNLTVDFDETVETNQFNTGASSNFAAPQTALSVTCDPSAAITAAGLLLAAFR